MLTARLNACLVLLPILLLGACASFAQTAKPKAAKSAPAKPAKKSDNSGTGALLGLRELTDLALRNSPELAKAEADLRVATAKKRIVNQPRDPEIRAGYGKDDLLTSEVREPGQNDTIRKGRSASARLRLFPPNPWVMRANMYKALQEISYADFVLGLMRRQIVMSVRRQYAALQFHKEGVSLADGAYQIEAAEYERLSLLLKSSSITHFEVNKRLVDSLSKKNAAPLERSKFQQVRSSLASTVGLANPNRIAVVGVPVSPLVEFRADTQEVLAEIAFLNSLELSDLRHQERLVLGDLSALNARKIPWFSYIEIGNSRDFRGESHDLRTSEAVRDTYGVQVGVDLPIFTWMGKEAKVFREQIRGYQEQAARRKLTLDNQVATAIANIRATSAALGGYDQDSRQVLNTLNELPTDDLATPYHKQSVEVRWRKDRLQIEQAYHDAVLSLEQLLGMDLVEAFQQRPATEAAPPEKAAKN